MRYRVIKPRFVYQRRYYACGDELEAAPNPLLRRAVRDGDLEPVEPKARKTPKRRAQAGTEEQ